jgi:TolB-like protein/Tfp pilus assembly protein PilF
MDLYRGDFLPGLHIEASMEFEAWVEHERQRLRKVAAGGAWSLAWEELGQDRVSDAERSAGRAVHLACTDEESVRGFMVALARAGYQVSALNLFDLFSKTLGQLMEMEPSPQTLKLAEAIKKEGEFDADEEGLFFPHPSPGSTLPPTSGESGVHEPSGEKPIGQEGGDKEGGIPPEAAQPGLIRTLRNGLIPKNGLLRVAALAAVSVVVFLMAIEFAGVWSGEVDEESHVPAIAVLPCEDRSPDPRDAYLSGAVHDEILLKLQGLTSLLTIGPAAVKWYEVNPAPLTQVARELDVGFVGDCSVQKTGDRFRVIFNLLDGSTGGQIWAQEYEGDLNTLRLLEIQRDIAERVAAAVGAQLTREEEDRFAELPDVDPEAYDLYLRGLDLYDRRDAVRFQEAIALLERSIELAPSFAPSHAVLADVFQSQAAYFLAPTGEANARAKGEALAALDIDNSLSRAYGTLAWAEMSSEYDWEAAEGAFLHAIRLDERGASPHQEYGQFLVYMGRTVEGLQHLRRAVELDSISPIPTMFLGVGLFFSRRYEEAIAEQRRVLRRDPDLPHAHYFLASALTGLGLHAQALEEFQKAVDLGGPQPLFLAASAEVHVRMGRRDSAAAILQELLKRSEEGDYVPPDLIAWPYLALGQSEEAMNWLERAYEEKEQGMVYLNMLRNYDPLRSHPRFQALLRKMNFPVTSGGG